MPEPPPAHALIVDAWLEDTQTLNVKFDQPVTVFDGLNVGTWLIEDTGQGNVVPTELVQTDVDSIWLFTAVEITSGIVGYTGADPGGLSSANGFPASDSHAY